MAHVALARRITHRQNDVEVGNGRELHRQIVAACPLVANRAADHGQVARLHAGLHAARGPDTDKGVGANGVQLFGGNRR